MAASVARDRAALADARAAFEGLKREAEARQPRATRTSLVWAKGGAW